MANPENMMQVNWRVDFSTLNALDATLRPLTEEAVRHTLDDVIHYIDNHWSDESPSSPYQPPAIGVAPGDPHPGMLKKSARLDRRSKGGQFSNTQNAVSWSLRYEAEYAAAQEFGSPTVNLLPRPFLRPAIKAVEGNLGKYIKTILEFRKPRGIFEVINPYSAQRNYINETIGGLG